MTHRHRKITIEANGDDTDGVRGTFVPDGHWAMQARFWLAAALSIFIAGVSAVVWMNTSFVAKRDMDAIRAELAKHEQVDVVTKSDFQRHEALPSHPQMFGLVTEVRLQLEQVKAELAFLRAELRDREEKHKKP